MKHGKNPLLAAAALLALSPLAWGAEKPVLGGLLGSGGWQELPSVAAVGKARVVAVAAPNTHQVDGVNVLCTMDMRYKDTVYGFLIVRAWRELKGTATLTCVGREPIRIEIEGQGFAPGVQLPNQSPVHSVNEGRAANIEVRMPTAFAPRQIEGKYFYAGVDIVGIGGAVSPFVNTDASVNITFSLPASLNVSAGINITKLTVRLAQ